MAKISDAETRQLAAAAGLEKKGNSGRLGTSSYRYILYKAMYPTSARRPVRSRSRRYACFAAFRDGNRSGQSLAASVGICGTSPRAIMMSMASGSRSPNSTTSSTSRPGTTVSLRIR